tara:strand:- start:1733 stop:1894 length:162 start_codon:yes stop_codon:yes gene_type:complete
VDNLLNGKQDSWGRKTRKTTKTTKTRKTTKGKEMLLAFCFLNITYNQYASIVI